MRRGETRGKERGPGLMAQLRDPPGGRDARIMLLALAVDRTGSGLWAASSVLYLTFVTHLSAQQIGVLLGVAGVAGIAGSPLAGRLAGRFPVRSLLVGCHLLRLVTLVLVLVCTGFDALLPVVAVTYLGDRAAKTLEMLFATRAAGERRAAYQALSRSAANAGYGVGAGIAAIGLAVGTTGAYRVLILGNALSFVVAAVLVWRTGEPSGSAVEVARSGGAAPAARGEGKGVVRGGGPWRDRGYLRFVLLDIPMNLDDSILAVGLPLWLVNRTSAPHALVPAFLVINTVLVVVLQLSVSKRAEGPRRAARAVLLYGVLMLACCGFLAVATRGGAWAAGAVLLAAALLVTLAELMRSVSSWELAVLLAPQDARAAYLGVAGMSQSIQKSAGPPLLTGVVMAAGLAGWLVLGAAVAGLAVVQSRACARRLGLGPARAGPPSPPSET
ncbi:MFS transporter [Streptomyces sp. NBC_00053]|uniref:MFS transporter n=1 Tax=unclassified Streptomyces TaxID=2593676 RepID=UPI00225064B8|nr:MULTISPECIES: MFS transporter [unclassified Streptomyces]MCX5160893.1 MFS transporter [Streptomyces sp. NBC_00305]MCX5219416.1 MFS transporter [Streptomyces sp. NBC_00264]MCX5501158.1 MFS transporter [Streptomyces sp. NBC_00052]MCX5550307.1 MFS transporter [Streptomyces sp. NBC_00051]